MRYLDVWKPLLFQQVVSGGRIVSSWHPGSSSLSYCYEGGRPSSSPRRITIRLTRLPTKTPQPPTITSKKMKETIRGSLRKNVLVESFILHFPAALSHTVPVSVFATLTLTWVTEKVLVSLKHRHTQFFPYTRVYTCTLFHFHPTCILILHFIFDEF